MRPETLLNLLLALIIGEYLLGQFLDYLDLKSLKQPIPQKLKDVYNQEEYDKSQKYHRVKTRFGFFSGTFSFLLYLGVIYFGVLGQFNDYLASYIDNSILLALAFFGILFIVSDLLSLPFSLYNTFVIEERFGFNKTTPKVYLTDKFKGYFLGAVIGGAILSILLFLIQVLGDNFWIVFWVVVSAIMLLVNMFYTSLIMPLFNKLTPLEDGELKTAIEDYAQKVSFPVNNIYVIDGSKRSTKANAFFSGIGKKKKIVLYDTLINDHTTEELVAILAHEVGHFKRKHIVQSFVISILQTGLMLFVLSLFINAESMSIALGASSHQVHLNLIVFGMLFTPITMITSLFMNLLSRKNEYEADAYAAETYQASPLQVALKKLSANNLSNLTPDKINVFLHYSHPPLLQRLNALDKFK